MGLEHSCEKWEEGKRFDLMDFIFCPYCGERLVKEEPNPNCLLCRNNSFKQFDKTCKDCMKRFHKYNTSNIILMREYQ